MSFISFIQARAGYLLGLAIDHVQITIVAVAIACIIGIPLGIFLVKHEKLSMVIMSIINACQAIPSLAFLGILIPLTGIGLKTTVILVIIYAILPITKNTYTAIHNLDPVMLETARGIGLTDMQVLTKIQIPLALPVVMAGVRIAGVWAVGTVTVAAYAGGGGLGSVIYSGISMMNLNMILSGAILACLIALMMDFLIGLLEKLVTPDGLKNSKENK